jgi:hypothetical protein
MARKPTIPLRLRARAIFCRLYFGFLPWWVYERASHYGPREDGNPGMTWWEHLRLNVRRARPWAFGWPNEHEVDFEMRVNARPNWTRWHNTFPKEAKTT